MIKTESFAEALRMHRIQKRLTLRELEAMTGISNVAISQYENGQVNPTLKKAVTLAALLKFSLDEVTGLRPILEKQE